jgi:hypothetical protein
MADDKGVPQIAIAGCALFSWALCMSGLWLFPNNSMQREARAFVTAWMTVGLATGLTATALRDRDRRRAGRRAAGRCPACGYDLRATPDRCPECGAKAAAARTR